MGSIEVEMDDPKALIQKLAYVKFFANRGACSGINNELEYLKTLAIGNLSVKGVSQARPEASINSSWRIKSASPSEAFEAMGVLYNSSPHAGFVEVGTGPYAETNYFGKNYNKGTMFITPKTSKVLKFTYGTGVRPFKTSIKGTPDAQAKRGTSQYIFAHYVEGQEPKNYLGRAVLATRPRLLNEIGMFIMNDINNAGV
jgi:hypothetical protein